MAKNKPGGGFGSPASTPPRLPTIKSGGGGNNNNKNRNKNRNNNNNGNKRKRRRNNNSNIGGGNQQHGGGNGVTDPHSRNNPYGTQYANPDVHAFASWLVHNFYNSSPDIQGLDLQNDGQGPMRYSVF